ncbi:hypothetical protein CCP2SC5_220042 [Azospirillaceae bacterium]
MMMGEEGGGLCNFRAHYGIAEANSSDQRYSSHRLSTYKTYLSEQGGRAMDRPHITPIVLIQN